MPQLKLQTVLHQADTMSAMHAGGLRAEVLAMCGVAEPLRQLDLAMPAEALFSLATMSCPLEGINCLQVGRLLVILRHRWCSSAWMPCCSALSQHQLSNIVIESDGD